MSGPITPSAVGSLPSLFQFPQPAPGIVTHFIDDGCGNFVPVHFLYNALPSSHGGRSFSSSVSGSYGSSMSGGYGSSQEFKFKRHHSTGRTPSRFGESCRFPQSEEHASSGGRRFSSSMSSGSASDQEYKRALYKTVHCETFSATGSCPYGETCRFAHGQEELRSRDIVINRMNEAKYKTRFCDKVAKYGSCPYGTKCKFIHPDDVLPEYE